MHFYFIRHGQSGNNALYAQTGSSQGRTEDPELTPTGRQQALYLGRYLADLAAAEGRLTHLYCSLMLRAVDTAVAVSAATGVPAVAWADWHEGGGIYQDRPASSIGGEPALRAGLPGKPRAYFQQHYPSLGLPAELDGRGWWNRPFEELAQRQVRARRVLQELLRRHAAPNPLDSQDCVAVISHGGFYNHFMRAVLGLPPRQTEDEEDGSVWFSLHNTALTRIDFLGGGLIVQYQNRTQFLPLELIT